MDQDVVWSVSFSPDGTRLATASGDEVVTLWDPETGSRIASLTGHSGGATDVAFLSDGATLTALDRNGRLHFWDMNTGRTLARTLAGSSWRQLAHCRASGWRPVRDRR